LNRKEACKNILMSALNVYEQKISARKCLIVSVKSKDQRLFLEKYHIQGYVPAKIALGLQYKGCLVGLLTLGKPRERNSKNNHELLRLCFKTGVKIIGGSLRLWKNTLYFIPPGGSVVSFSDRSLFSGEVYNRLGFKLKKITPPGFRYINNRAENRSRQSAQKHKIALEFSNFDKNKTEEQIMAENGWWRVYNAGHYRFEFVK
jgi:hypothetical protein